MMNLLDLFSGIGGFSLGLERSGGFKTVAFCEIDPYCRAVIKKHWPDVPCYEDVRTLTAGRLAADGIATDVVCGGFPCQPFSSAARGRTSGVEDDRYLWPEMFRIISETRPSWIIAENVTHIESVALENVVSDMETCGYEVATFEIPACAVGFDHWRPRIWICGHANRNGEPRLPIDAEMAWMPGHRSNSGGMGASHGLPSRMDRLAALGSAVVPQIPEIIGKAILSSMHGGAR